MKSYSNEFIEQIRHCIKFQNYELSSVEDIEDFPKTIKINGVKICLSVRDDGQYESTMYLGEDMNNENLTKWYQTAVGRYYSKDWRKQKTNPDFYKQYAFLNVITDTIQVRMLVRKIELTDFEDEETFDAYTDISIDGVNYVIIKAYSLDDELEEFFSYDSMFESKFNIQPVDDIGLTHIMEIPGNDDMDIADMPEDNDEQEELF